MPFDADQEHLVPFIHETRSSKSLHFSIVETQSCMNLAQPDLLDFEYTRIMMGFMLFHPAPLAIGMIGLGGGSLAKFCHRHLPAAHVTVVEINPHVIALRDEFAIPPDGERFVIVRGDGARYVKTVHGALDVLLVDGYDYDGMPPQLASAEFYADGVACLKPGGVLVANVHQDHADFRALLDRLGDAFSSPALSVKGRTEGNAVVFARKGLALAGTAVEVPRRPPTLAPRPWWLLQSAFGLIGAELSRQSP
ncbi:MAG: transferase [Betaproteobacteria bacterium]